MNGIKGRITIPLLMEGIGQKKVPTRVDTPIPGRARFSEAPPLLQRRGRAPKRAHRVLSGLFARYQRLARS